MQKCTILPLLRDSPSLAREPPYNKPNKPSHQLAPSIALQTPPTMTHRPPPAHSQSQTSSPPTPRTVCSWPFLPHSQGGRADVGGLCPKGVVKMKNAWNLVRVCMWMHLYH